MTDKDEYVIINKTAIQKRIEELEKLVTCTNSIPRSDIYYGRMDELKKVLSQSTPLIPEIEKAFVAGENYQISEEWHEDYEGEITQQNKQDYISNLKLNI